jgi:hypothetical protein
LSPSGLFEFALPSSFHVDGAVTVCASISHHHFVLLVALSSPEPFFAPAGVKLSSSDPFFALQASCWRSSRLVASLPPARCSTRGLL